MAASNGNGADTLAASGVRWNSASRVSATARASFSIYNTEQEVDAFVDALLAARKILQ